MASSQSTLFFYDLETSGIDARRHRIMQFAGQRTDMDLEPVGEPVDIKVALSDDVLPEPQAILVTGITPQQTRDEGYNEAEFLKIFQTEVCMPDTTIVGFNSVRFDDEFMRFTLWRNFYDAYEWQWKEGCSRWDLLDAARMTRALRPEGIKWPVDENGAPTNRLELLARENGIGHAKAHDALSDVYALIDVAKLIKNKQPKLFDYLYSMRSKRGVEKLADPSHGQLFVYTTGRYPKETAHTSVVMSLSEGSRPGCVIVYDLRHDPAAYADKSVEELKKLRFATREMRGQDGFLALPGKELAFNKCPAVAPLGTFDAATQERIGLTLETIEKHKKALLNSDLKEKLKLVFEASPFPKSKDADGALYDGFVSDTDKNKMRAVRSCTPDDVATFQPDFKDTRLNDLLVRYKARNYPQSLSADERGKWEEYRTTRLQADAPQFVKQLQEVSKTRDGEHDQFLLQELQLWFESVMPLPE